MSSDKTVTYVSGRAWNPIHDFIRPERPSPPKLGGRADIPLKRKKPEPFGRAFCKLNRATSYSPTHLRVQYHRG